LKPYKTLLKPANKEIIINKSRFIGYASPAQKEEEALEFIEKIKKMNFNATHNVYAYIIGNNNIQRFTDDGEPSGTAGKPVLEVVKREGLINVVVVVTRYFGGIKLGAGGLIRAYSRSAKEAVEAAGISEKVPFYRYKLTIDYPFLGKIQNEINKIKQVIGNIDYMDRVRIEVFVDPTREKEFRKKILSITNGQVEFSKETMLYLTRYKGKILFNTA